MKNKWKNCQDVRKLQNRKFTQDHQILVNSNVYHSLKVSVAAILSGNNDIQFKIGRTPYLDTFYAVRV